MKKCLLFLIFITTVTCQAQVIFSFKELTKDSLYAIENNFISAYDSRKDFTCAFPNQDKEVLQRWTDLHIAFQDYLIQNAFTHNADMHIFFRFYFRHDGSIKYVGYHLATPLTNELLQKFEKHLHEFIKKQTFGMQAKQQYAQCGSVTYKKLTNQE